LFGVLCGSVTLTGGPATGLAFASQFEAAGVEGAEAVAVAAAMIGIVTGGLIGAPIGTLLIERRRRTEDLGRLAASEDLPQTAQEVVEAQLPSEKVTLPVGEDVESYSLLKSVAIILLAMWAGSWVGGWITAAGVRLPAYIGAMLVAAVLRNLDDATGWLRLSQNVIDDIGNVALAFFLVLSLMTLELWTLAAVAFPLLAVLVVQAVLITVLCFWPIFPFMGKDYDSAVLSGGFCGFMMGTTANAMANMDALVQRYGPAPRAYLIVPMVGAFFIDFTNALLIQGCLNLFS
jgi:ESS family glutamate:Na+ symporter